jgi:asparagine synthase (glutamine-hydrolysing)
MCGIFGFVSAEPHDAAVLQRKLATGLGAIRHRGPDGERVWQSEDGRVGFAHARLAIVGIETGAQPMHDADAGLTIVYNGEIYNYIELREELGAATFRTDSDTEVILRAYRAWGADCVTRLRGMFSFAIWDARQRSLFLARDRFGIKPLYLAHTREGLFFASEMKALVPFLPSREVHAPALSEYFVFQFCVGGPSLMNGIVEFPAAHHGMSRGGPVRPVRYWEVHYAIDHSHDEVWFTRRMQELLHDSVRVHLRADVEIGTYLSGGMDSTLIGALAREYRPEGRFLAFNGRFDGAGFDESAYAATAADEYGMQLDVTHIGEQDFVDGIERIVWHLDQPTAGPGAFPQYLVAKAAASKIKVVLGGQGGDEMFGGYARYLAAYFEQCIKGAIEGTLHKGQFVVTYESIIPNLVTLADYKPMLREFWAEGLFEERDRRYWRLINRSNAFAGMLAPGVLDADAAFERFRSIFWGANVGEGSYFDAMTHFDFKTLLPALLHVEDRMSMAHGMEARVPFLDHPLVELAATIPAHIKFKGGELKRMLKLAFGERLPTAIRVRKDKMGFPVPLNDWLLRGGPARDFVGDVLSSQRARTRPYLADGVPLDRLLSGEGAYGRGVWALLCLELWHRKYVDAA